ncbi:MAG: sugar phosphate nucleotidyltransferase [candidate division Zixibacteria bacterium]|nr:sugar phosphate nucleotidyltransferase [candidate division Zixibacteria bacterium]
MSHSAIAIKQAVILAGGEGRRLLPYTKILPKPLWPVGNVPIIEILLRQLAKSGIKEAILAVGHQAELIKMILGDGKQLGLKVHYSQEAKPLGTAGPLKKIKRLDDNFLVLNGDLLTDLPFHSFMTAHLKYQPMATVAVFRRSIKADFGVISEKNHKIIKYLEKPSMDYSVSMGIYAFNRKILNYIPDRKFDFPELVKRLIKLGQNPLTYHFRGRWLDIGRTDDWEKADRIFRRKPKLFLH